MGPSKFSTETERNMCKGPHAPLPCSASWEHEERASCSLDKLTTQLETRITFPCPDSMRERLTSSSSDELRRRMTAFADWLPIQASSFLSLDPGVLMFRMPRHSSLLEWRHVAIEQADDPRAHGRGSLDPKTGSLDPRTGMATTTVSSWNLVGIPGQA